MRSIKPPFLNGLLKSNTPILSKKTKWLLLAFFMVQLCILAGMITKSMMPLVTGTCVKLPVEGRDPRNIFRGDYVDLEYEYSTMYPDSYPNNLVDGMKFTYGDPLYIELKPDTSQVYHTSGIFLQPQNNPNALYLRALVQSEYTYYKNSRYNAVSLKAGIEEYFTTSERALSTEKMLRFTNTDSITLYTHVCISPKGEARIKEIIFPDSLP